MIRWHGWGRTAALAVLAILLAVPALAQGGRMVDVPVRAGERSESGEVLPLPIELVGTSESFLYRVDCEGYKQEAIMPGDLLIVNPDPGARDGDMVLARSSEDGPARLCTYKTSAQPDSRLLGRVIGVIRKIPVG